MADKLKIHFVCRGNILRSRLAEAYAKSQNNDSLIISSSGVEADKYPISFVSPWAKSISNQSSLGLWFAKQRTQTTDALLNQNDLIIFMSKDVYYDAQKKYGFNKDNYVIWHIKDRGNRNQKLSAEQKQREMFKLIKLNVDQLLDSLIKT
jgi:protein-tyrosine-phosphatase